MAIRRCEYLESMNMYLTFYFRGGIAVVWLGQRVKPSLNGHGPVGGYVAMK
jgi:serine/threonine protein kinase